MIVKKLRLQKGWSQEHLAELTDLSIRTIQRVERGQKPSFETARSLAAIFEVELSIFQIGETTMNNESSTNTETVKNTQNNNPTLKDIRRQLA